MKSIARYGACAVVTLIAGSLWSSTLSEALADDTRVRRFALVVGSNHGGTNRVQLRYAGSDADNFAKVMTELGGVAPRDVLVLRDPSRTELDSGFDSMRRRIDGSAAPGVRSELLVYYSGHSDEDGLLLFGERYPYAQLRQRIGDMPSDVNIAVLDSCASGALTRRKGGIKRPPFLSDESVAVSGYAYLTSSSADEVAQESDRIAASYFTHYLVSGMRGGADANRDERVTLNELYQFAFTETVSRTQTTQAGAQHPAYDIHLVGTGDVVMTDLRATSAALVFADDVAGRLYIHDPSGRLMLETHKEAGQRAHIGLPALDDDRSYAITLKRRDGAYQVSAPLARGARTLLAGADFAAIASEPTIARGGSVPMLPAPTTPSPTGAAEIQAQGAPGSDAHAYRRHDQPRRWSPISIQLFPLRGARDDVVNLLQLNVIAGQSAHLQGIELGGITNVRRGDLRGVQLAGIANVGGRGTGVVQAAGIANVSDGASSAVQAAGIVNYVDGGFSGAQAGGIANVTGGDTRALQAAGIANYVDGGFSGAQAGGIANVTGGDTRALQAAGIANYVDGGFFGAQAGGIANVTGGDTRALQAAGVANYVDGGFFGAQAGGIANVTGGDTRALQAAGIANYTDGRFSGVQLSGIANVSGDGAWGIRVGGVANVAGGHSTGLHVAGVANAIEGDFRGIQVSSIANYTQGRMQGVQVALVNVGGAVQGGQIGLVNVADRVDGFQLGLVNVSNDGGAPIGFVNFSRNGRFDLEAWTSDTTPMSVGLKLGASRVYGVLSIASDKDRYLFGWGLGVHTPRRGYYLDVDLLGYTLTDHDLKDSDNDFLGSLRLALGVPLGGGFSVFGGVALNGAMALDGKPGDDMSFVKGATLSSDSIVLRVTPGFFGGISY